MASTYCPDCDEEIVLNSPTLGYRFTCPHCDADLEVISLDPFELDWAYDWSEDEWEEDEEDTDEEDEEEDEDW
jgi:lysine biosynthesis protein LysW